MSDSLLLLWVLVGSWLLSIIFGAVLGSQKNAGDIGLLLGLLFGPLGVVIAGMVDKRPFCGRCGGRQNVNSTKQRFPICEHCGTVNLSPAPQKNKAGLIGGSVSSFMQGLAGDGFIGGEYPTDPGWEESLEQAKRKLDEAGLIGRGK